MAFSFPYVHNLPIPLTHWPAASPAPPALRNNKRTISISILHNAIREVNHYLNKLISFSCNVCLMRIWQFVIFKKNSYHVTQVSNSKKQQNRQTLTSCLWCAFRSFSLVSFGFAALNYSTGYSENTEMCFEGVQNKTSYLSMKKYNNLQKVHFSQLAWISSSQTGICPMKLLWLCCL